MFFFATDSGGQALWTTDGNLLGTRRILSVNEMDDNVYATPAIVDGVLYLRTHSALYAFAEPNE